jgi:cyclopropane fatty-acyl-phospholipid synthase-like methyltransferase
MCSQTPEKPEILELGCGSGGASIPLAQISGGIVTATEIYQPFLDVLIKRAKTAKVEDRIIAAVMDMAHVESEPECFDLIWCEGAAYIMGVDKALPYWKQYLKPGGYLVFSDAVWLSHETRDNAPEDLKTFWAEGYPVMRTAEENVAAAESFGYKSLGHFTIDHQCWVDFYNDVESRINEVEPIFGSDPDGRAIIDMTKKEIALFRAHPKTYGYEMHILKK